MSRFYALSLASIVGVMSGIYLFDEPLRKLAVQRAQEEKEARAAADLYALQAVEAGGGQVSAGTADVDAVDDSVSRTASKDIAKDM
jgi:hypothetical protein